MKKYTILLLLPLFSMLFTSCLKEGLDEGILSTECDVTNVHFEHRWATEMSTPGMYQLNFIEMTVNRTIDTENCVIDVQITVPAVSATIWLVPLRFPERPVLSLWAMLPFWARWAIIRKSIPIV